MSEENKLYKIKKVVELTGCDDGCDRLNQYLARGWTLIATSIKRRRDLQAAEEIVYSVGWGGSTPADHPPA